MLAHVILLRVRVCMRIYFIRVRGPAHNSRAAHKMKD